MILAIDVGNSNIVIGGYQNDAIQFVSRIATDRHFEADQYAIQFKAILELYAISGEPIEGIAIASVVPDVTQVLTRACAHLSSEKPMLLSLANAGDIVVDIENPAELGMDILASAIAVRHTRPLPAIIIDMGTATKLTALDQNGNLRGVAISPGLFVSLEALVSGASLLGDISVEPPQVAIGRNTPDSMKSGVVLGTAAMLDGMIDRFAAELGGLSTVVATGGAASIVIQNCRNPVEYSDTLLLDGLYYAYKHQ